MPRRTAQSLCSPADAHTATSPATASTAHKPLSVLQGVGCVSRARADTGAVCRQDSWDAQGPRAAILPQGPRPLWREGPPIPSQWRLHHTTGAGRALNSSALLLTQAAQDTQSPSRQGCGETSAGSSWRQPHHGLGRGTAAQVPAQHPSGLSQSVPEPSVPLWRISRQPVTPRSPRQTP